MTSERLDELLGMASDLGRCESRLAAAERSHENATRKSDTYPDLRRARADRDAAANRLTHARARALEE